MAAGDLTTLANVKTWLNSQGNGDDALLGRLITSASRFILNTLGRPKLDVHSVVELRDGTGRDTLRLREFPVLSIEELKINGSVVTPQDAPPFGTGYIFDPWDGQDACNSQGVYVFGQMFWRGRRNISLRYTAGYRITDEPQQVPAANTFTVSVSRPWTSDQGVRYASGDAMTRTTSAPSKGQYSVSQGVYTFSADDADAEVMISYGYVPEDLAHVCMELVGERFRSKDRIGQVSKSLGGNETISFSQRDMNAYLASVLNPYQSMTPI